MKMDLHCHSHYSDGSHTIEYLIKRAAANKVTHLAITDHDCIFAHQKTYALPHQLHLISGVEISCQWSGREIHVVGLNIDCSNSKLREALALQQHKRRERMQAMSKKLAAIHQCDLMEHLDTLPCISMTRTHVADFLVEKAFAKSHEKAFKKFLSRNGKLYEPIQWMDMTEAVSAITRAGGLAVIAHPSRYKLTRSKLIKLFEDFSAAGGDAAEVSYSNLDPQSKTQLLELCNSTGLSASCGSDFHSEKNHWMDIGKFAPLSPDTKNAIWNHPRWHLQLTTVN